MSAGFIDEIVTLLKQMTRAALLRFGELKRPTYFKTVKYQRQIRFALEAHILFYTIEKFSIELQNYESKVHHYSR